MVNIFLVKFKNGTSGCRMFVLSWFDLYSAFMRAQSEPFQSIELKPAAAGKDLKTRNLNLIAIINKLIIIIIDYCVLHVYIAFPHKTYIARYHRKGRSCV